MIRRLRRHFCVGFEMPPWLVRLLDELLVPYLDLHIHPVRFMDDLLLRHAPRSRKARRFWPQSQ